MKGSRQDRYLIGTRYPAMRMSTDLPYPFRFPSCQKLQISCGVCPSCILAPQRPVPRELQLFVQILQQEPDPQRETFGIGFVWAQCTGPTPTGSTSLKDCFFPNPHLTTIRWQGGKKTFPSDRGSAGFGSK